MKEKNSEQRKAAKELSEETKSEEEAECAALWTAPAAEAKREFSPARVAEEARHALRKLGMHRRSPVEGEPEEAGATEGSSVHAEAEFAPGKDRAAREDALPSCWAAEQVKDDARSGPAELLERFRKKPSKPRPRVLPRLLRIEEDLDLKQARRRNELAERMELREEAQARAALQEKSRKLQEKLNAVRPLQLVKSLTEDLSRDLSDDFGEETAAEDKEGTDNKED